MNRNYKLGLLFAVLLAAGCTETSNTPPTAKLEGPDQGRIHESLQFSALGSADAEDRIRAYAIDFGDGTPLVKGLPEVSHRFEKAGEYEVILRVFDMQGASAIAKRQVTIEDNAVPVAVFDGPLVAYAGQVLTFDATASQDGDGEISTYAFTFGDGGAANSAKAAHAYSAAGVYDVSLTVTDNDGATATLKRPVEIRTVANSVQPPLARLTAPNLANALELLTFDASQSSVYEGQVEYQIDFGDGQSAWGPNVNHAYAVGGDYVATLMLTVRYADGSTTVSIDAKSLHIRALKTANSAPLAAFSMIPSARFGTPVAFDGTLSSAPGASSVNYVWNFDDGASSAEPVEVHAFANAGLYVVRLQMTAWYPDGTSNSSLSSRVLQIEGNVLPVAMLDTPPQAKVGDMVLADSLGSRDADGGFIATLIDYGDGFTALSPVASHAYTAPGNYTITLTVTDIDGATTQAGRPITVQAHNEVLAAPAAVLTGPASLIVNQPAVFNALSSAVPAGTPSYRIEFGDGQWAGVSTISHAYAVSGEYLARAIVTATYADATTSWSIATWPVSVKTGAASFAAPVANFSAPLIARFNEVVNVDASASSAPGALSVAYAWDFGDLSSGSGISAGHTYVPNTYTISLTVTATYSDGSQSTATAERVVTIRPNTAPLASLTGDTQGLTTQVLSFDASASGDADGTLVLTEIDFGDGSLPTNAPVATHAYAAAGEYTVQVTVTDNDGASATTLRVVTVRSYNATVAAPVVTLSGPTQLVVSQTGTFSAAGSSAPGSSTVAYKLYFGDGAVSLNVADGHAFSAPGDFLVRALLTASYPDGTTNTAVATIPVSVRAGNSLNAAPSAVFTAPDSIRYSQTLNVNANGSSAPGAASVAYRWYFGDGGISTGASASHQYTAGVYPIGMLLTATYSDGSTTTAVASRMITVNANATPVAVLTGATGGVAGESLSFDASGSSDSDGSITTFSLNFGNGDPLATSPVVTHAYPAAGIYTVTLTVTDSDGVSAVTTRVVTIKAVNNAVAAPVASFLSPQNIRYSQTASFDGSASTAPGAANVAYQYDFGDGATANQVSASHTYAPGVYTASLIVTASYADGTTNTAMTSRQISVSANAAPVAVLTAPAAGLASDVLGFDATGSQDSDGTIVSYQIDFGDGSPAGTSPGVTHAYTAPGDYTVTLLVTDNDGTPSSTTRTVSIRAYNTSLAPPVAILNGPGSLVVNQTGTFDATGSGAPGASNVTYRIDFGDGQTSLTQPASHAYTTPGNPTASLLLTATYADGTTNTSVAYLPVAVNTGSASNPAPMASFTVPASARFSDVVNVDAGTSTAPGAASVTYDWDFGDLSAGAGISAGHTFTPGTYTIRLTVTATYSDGSQATSTADRMVAILPNAAPVAVLTGDTQGLSTELLNFDTTGSGDVDGILVSTVLDFGDGAWTSAPAATHSYATAGTYTVRATVTDNDGDTATTIRVVTIRPYNTSLTPPLAVLSGPTQLTATAAGVFGTIGSTAPGAASVTYKTYFGDGATAWGQTTSHAYATAGFYTASLLVTATYADGTSSTATAVLPVQVISEALANGAPTAFISAPATARFGTTVFLSAAGSGAPGASSVVYAWDFGDTGSAIGVNTSHVYSAGLYSISLTVTATYGDGSVNAATASQVITVAPNTAPAVSLTGDSTGLVSQVLGFDASASSDSDGAIVATVIDFGDGSPTTSAPVATHAYAAAGTYTVRATVTDNDGADATTIRLVTVRPFNVSIGLPVAVLSGPTELIVNQPGAFTAAGSTAPGAASTAYKLYFDDGATSLNVADGHAYASAGNYLVRVLLTVTYPDNTTNTVVATLPVAVRSGNTLNAAPSAAINAPSNLRFSETANVDAGGSTAPGASTMAHKWYFGDGATAMGASTAHQYAAGVYPLSLLLTATYSDGSTATAVANRVITVNPNAAPVAVLTGATAGTAGETFTFDAGASTDADGAIATYAINFGDASPIASSPVVTHTYTAAGTYLVTLTVTDNDGASAATTRLVSVTSVSDTVAAPTASFTATASLRFSEPASFDANASAAPGATGVSYKFYFGDGATAMGVSTSHTYAPGVYTASLLLTASYADGTTNTAVMSRQVVVLDNAAPVAILAAATTGLASDVLSFDASLSTDSDGAIASYVIDFGDASPAGTASVVTHAYAVPGDYTVTLTVIDNDGGTATTSRVVSIDSYKNRVALPLAVLNGPTQLIVNQNGVFSSTGSLAPAASSIATKLYFGDGATSLQPSASHAFATPGNVTASLLLTATYPDGTTHTAVAFLPVEVKTGSAANPAPVASFSAPASQRFSAIANVDASGTTAPGATNVAYDWDFGDLTAGAGLTADHTFAPGTYTIQLTVTATYSDGSNAASMASRMITVFPNAAPVAVLTGNTQGLATQPLAFDASGSSDMDGLIAGTLIDFGDGNSTSAPAATHTYATAGTYTVRATVTDNDGDSTSTINVVTIRSYSEAMSPPVATLTGPAQLTATASGVFGTAGSGAPGASSVAYKIYFGDGQSAMGQSVSHAYPLAGNYQASLLVTATYADGTTNTATSVTPVEVISGAQANPAPTASLNAPATARFGATVLMSAAGSSAPGATAIAYGWDFGDSGTGTGLGTSHVYAAGTHAITLTVTATYNDGSVNTATALASISIAPNAAPVAVLTGDTVGRVTQAVGFDASGSSDADGSLTTTTIDFGDGSPVATAAVATHTYATPGEFTVVATVTDNDGATASATRIVTITPFNASAEQPIANLSGPTQLTVGQAGVFTATGSSTPGATAAYKLYFGDGASTTDNAGSHSYAAGDYLVRLLVIATYPDATSNMATAVLPVQVRSGSSLNAAPQASISAPATARFSSTVNVDAAASTAPGASSVAYKWYFGDGAIALGNSASHVYLAGTYPLSVLLTATYSDGSTATAVANRSITIQENALPAAVLTGAVSGTALEALTFDASGSSDSDGTIVSTLIDFGDTNSSTSTVATHAYAAAGAYTVTVTVTDNDGGVAVTTRDVTIEAVNSSAGQPVASFTAPSSVRFSQAVQVDASSSTADGASSVAYMWYFGDAATGMGSSASHVYTPGVYTVSLLLTATYADGTTNTAVTTRQVSVVPNAAPMALLTGSTSGLASDTLSFDASGSSDSDGVIASVLIDFGDASSSTSPVATHAYATPGVYTVTLTVTDNDGAPATTTRLVTVDSYNASVAPPQAVLNGPTQLIEGETGAYSANGSGAQGGVVTYKLYFGNGNTLAGIAGSTSYPSAGDYQVSVLVTATYPDATTAMATAVLPVHVITAAQASSQPFARFTAPVVAIPSTMVTLDGSTSTPGSGYITTYNWDFGDGRPSFDGASSVNVTFPTHGAHNITLTVTNSAGLSNSTQRQISVFNNKPTLAGANLDTAPYYEESLISVTPVGYYDADGEAAQYFFYWYVNGVGVGNNYLSQINGNSFSRGDTVQAEVVPFDGFEVGDRVWSDVATILNSAPELARANLNASPHYESSTLTATPDGWYDADGDAPGYQYQWFVNSVAVVTGTTASLNGADFNHFDMVYAEITPDDGFGGGMGAPVASEVLVISNTAPSMVTTVIDPASYDENSVLTLTLVSDDIDGDPVTFGYQWQVDSGSGFVSISSAVQPTLAGGNFNETDQVRVIVTPHDPYSIGASQTSAAVTIGNTTPTMVSVAIAPMSGFETSTLVASPLATDLDPVDNPLNAANYAYEWYVNAGLVAGQTTNSLNGTFFDKDDSVFARVTYTDGTATSAPLDSAALTIQNSAPVMTAVNGLTVTSLTFTSIGGGFEHSCGLTTDGGVKCWGGNREHMLGDGTTTDRPVLGDVSGLASGVTRLHSNYFHSCAIDNAGGLKCWGYNGLGQLGIGDASSQSLPVTPTGMASGVSDVTGGYAHTCALSTAGGVQCWGENTYGQLGDGTTLVHFTPEDVSGLTSGVKAIAAGDFQTCALTSAGGVKCWGNNGNGRLGDNSTTSRSLPTDVFGLTSGVTQITAGHRHTCALTSAGGVKCWGHNDQGQLGVENGAITESPIPLDVPALTSGVAAVSAGANHSCVLTVAGGMKCWGDNLYGTIGDGSNTDRPGPTDVTGLTSGVMTISASLDHTCAVTTAGVAKCWGRDSVGKLGVVGSGNISLPAELEGTSTSVVIVNSFGPGPFHEMSTLEAQGTASDADTTDNPINPGQFSYTWFVNNVDIAVGGTILDGTNFNKGDQVKVEVTYTDNDSVVSAPLYSATVTIQNTLPGLSSATIASIGNPDYGTDATFYVDSWTGLGDIDPLDAPVVTFQWFVNGMQLVGETGRTLSGTYVINGDTVYAHVTPYDGEDFGLAVATNTATVTNTPPSYAAVQFGSGPFYVTSTLSAVTIGYFDADGDIEQTPALQWKVNGGNAATTQNFSGGFIKGDSVTIEAQPYDGASYGATVVAPAVTVLNSAPVMTGINGVEALPGGATYLAGPSGLHTCVISPAGGLKCWGRNDFGQLGDGSLTNRAVPVDVVGLSSGVVQVETGVFHTCAVLDTGAVKCWGRNNAGQLGNGTFTSSATAVDVTGLSSGVSYVGAGTEHSCALTSSGGVKCWGNNGDGRLGDGTVANSNTPVDVSGLTSGGAQLSVGHEHTCALTTGGGAKCWGRDGEGRLGTGAVGAQLTPADVSGLTSGVATITAGVFQSCAVTTSGAAKCWGYNGFGNLGDGTMVDKLIPTDVNGLTGGVVSVQPVYARTCALMGNGGVKCWGDNGSGKLGDGTTVNRLTPVDVVGVSNITQLARGEDHACVLDSAANVQCWGAGAEGQLGNGTFGTSGSPVTVTGLGGGITLVTGSLASGPVYETSTLEVQATATDADGADLPTVPAQFTYTWYVNNVVVPSVTGTVMDGVSFNKNDEVKVAVTYTDNDSAVSAPLYTAATTIQNTAPELSTAFITSIGDPAYGTAVTYFVDGWTGLTDIDPADAPTVTFQWYINAAPVAGQTGRTLPGGYVNKGDSVVAQVTPFDGDAFGLPVNSNAVNGPNTRPIVANVSFGSGPFYESDTLTANIAGYDDTDGDPLSVVEYRWFVNGLFVASTQALNAGFAEGDTVAVSARASDGEGFSPWVASIAVTIQNQIPQLVSASIMPSPASEVSTLTISFLANDADSGDTLTPHVLWRVNGGLVSTNLSIDGADFDKDDIVSAEVQVDDGTSYSGFVTATATIQNTPPDLDSATITSVGDPAYGTDATFYVDSWTGLSDVDPVDAPVLTYQWYVNGSPVAGQTTNTLSGLYYVEGDSVFAQVTPYDGVDFGLAVSTPAATIINTPPTIGSADVGSGPYYIGNTITVSSMGAADVDAGDTVSVEYLWFINGVAGSTATSINSGFAKGDTVTAGARAFDGTSYSNWVYAPAVTIQNSLPIVNVPTLSPDPAYTDDTIGYFTSSSDLDSDPVTYAKLWLVNSVSTGVTAETLASTFFVVGNAVTLELTPYDGEDYGATVTSAALVIQNTPPTQPGITFYPSPYAVGDSLYVTVTTASTDADGHPITYSYVWYRNGVNQGYASSTTLVTPNLLTGTGESWTVEVTPNDGFANGATNYAQKTLPQDWFAMGASPLSAREQSSMVWTGSEVILWGGWNGAGGFNDGARYNPTTDTWIATSTPSLGGRSAHATVWTGTEMIVWGGWSGSAMLADGERYNPATNSWSGLIASSGLTGRYALSAVWTGEEMVIWGGFDGIYPNNGHRYHPATNTWNTTAMATGPAGRQRHATVWTGKEMIIYSGYNGGGPQSDAWRYNPATNIWAVLPAAPILGGYATNAVWTGAEMVVFGGEYNGTRQNTGARYNPASNTWAALPAFGLEARSGHNMVWTGQEVIVWGGYGTSVLNNGKRYDPATNTWSVMSYPGIPGRIYASAVWTGNEMVVWGGTGASTVLSDGSRYRPYPTSENWLTVTLNGAPAGRIFHTAVWTGSEMIIWGGRDFPDANRWNTGSRYNPANDSWLPTATAPITGRYTHAAVWSGKELIVWGGYDSGNVRQSDGARYDPRTDSWQVLPAIPVGVTGRQQVYGEWTGREMLVWGGLTPTSIWRNDGARYDPMTNTWGTIASAPMASRGGMVSAWTGEVMLVWGGYNGAFPNTGARYFASANTWDTMSTTGVAGREYASSAWTGKELFVFGGKTSLCCISNTGFIYDPASNVWRTTSASPLAARWFSTSVWTGSEVLVWGGLDAINHNDGARYDPRSDTWAMMEDISLAGRFQHSAVWTGQEMVVWGGQNNATDFNDGARYTPPVTTDVWIATDTLDIDLPTARYHHVTVWTGSEVVIWGGNDSVGDTNTGGRYDPATDTWRPTTTAGAPAARNGAKAVWTGREMLMWGGASVKTGGRYNPASDSWGAIPTAGEPGPDGSGYRNMFAYAWTGREFAIWGGFSENNGDSGYPADGALYDPVSDTWRAMSAAGAPSGRHHSKGVWTGREFIVFGGHQFGVLDNFPYRFDPAAGPNGTWTTGSNVGAPIGRNIHAQVWTGKEMLVWGGDNGGPISDGGRYDPATNTWSTMAASPLSARYHHAFAWTGKEMLIWGGYNGTTLADGAAYDPRTGAWRSIITADAPSARHFDFNHDMASVWTGREWFIWGGIHQETGTRQNTGVRFIPGVSQEFGFLDTMESGANGWTSVATGGSNLWHQVSDPTCSPASSSPSTSWYFGISSSCTFDNGLTVGGRLMSPEIASLPAGAVLTFNYRRQTECGGSGGCTWDQSFVQISTNGGASFSNLQQIIDDSGTWQNSPAIDLSAYAGQNIVIGFEFNSFDSGLNSFLGWMIDDVEVTVP